MSKIQIWYSRAPWQPL